MDLCVHYSLSSFTGFELPKGVSGEVRRAKSEGGGSWGGGSQPIPTSEGA